MFQLKMACIPYLLLLVACAGAMGAEHSTGSGSDDWWTVYPDQSSGAGGQVVHPDWVIEALEEGPVLIYVHKECDYCLPQTEAVRKIADEFAGSITFYEINADSEDPRAEEAMQAYDPDGGVMYVPLTAIVTKSPDSSGAVGPVWHSTDKVTGEDWIRGYLEDALSRYT